MQCVYHKYSVVATLVVARVGNNTPSTHAKVLPISLGVRSAHGGGEGNLFGGRDRGGRFSAYCGMIYVIVGL